MSYSFLLRTRIEMYIRREAVSFLFVLFYNWCPIKYISVSFTTIILYELACDRWKESLFLILFLDGLNNDSSEIWRAISIT